jgi:hypothetical protein
MFIKIYGVKGGNAEKILYNPYIFVLISFVADSSTIIIVCYWMIFLMWC